MQPSHQLCIQFFIWLTISLAIELLIELMVELMMIIIDQLMKPIAAIVYHCDCYYYCISHVLSELIHELQYRSRTGKKRPTTSTSRTIPTTSSSRCAAHWLPQSHASARRNAISTCKRMIGVTVAIIVLNSVLCRLDYIRGNVRRLI